MRKFFLVLPFLMSILFFGLTQPAGAASDLYVATNGTNGGFCNQAAPCGTIEYALSIASDGDTIHVGGGNYFESVTIDKSVNIEGNPTCTPCTVWFSDGNIQVMVINNSATVTIRDFNIRGGSGVNGGAILTNTGTDVTLTDLYIYENEAYRGGAIYNRGEMVINDVRINENTAESIGGAIWNQGDMVLDDVRINNNTAETLGGAIYNEGTLTVQSTRLYANYAGRVGGAIYNEGTIDFRQTAIFDNEAFYSGGAIGNTGTIQFQSGLLTGNKAQHAVGGAVSNSNGGRVVIADAKVSNNTASSPCVYSMGERECAGVNPSGGAIFNGSESALVLSVVELDGNVANAYDEWDGKGGAVVNWGDALIAFSTFSSNRVQTEDYNYPWGEGSSKGGAFYNGGHADVYNSTFFENEVKSNGGDIFGAGIFNDTEGDLYIENSTITENNVNGTDVQAGGGIYNLGVLELVHATISHNLGSELEEPAEDIGSGLYNAGLAIVTNSIIAMNYGQDCFDRGGLNAQGENLDSDETCPGFSLGGENPLLGVLKDNGGLTFTRLLGGYSPALDSADMERCLLNDQRNYGRPYGEGCDLGAVEMGEG